MWDWYSRLPGKTVNGDTGDTACDHYHRFKEDVQLLKDLGVKAYRFSVAWPRIFPTGHGKVNAKGLDFYSQLVDELIKNDIQPFLGFYHWDHPNVLEQKGGWRNRDFPYMFADYASVVVKHLSDRVTHWITLNEPPCIAYDGYELGRLAPGAKEPPKVVNQIVHHVLLAHGLGVQAVRAHAKSPAQVGLAHNLGVKVPYMMESKEQRAKRKS